MRHSPRHRLLMEAVAKYQQVLAIKPNELDTHYNIGNALACAADRHTAGPCPSEDLWTAGKASS